MKNIVFVIYFLFLPVCILCAQEKKGVSMHTDPRLAVLINKTKAPERDDDREPAKPTTSKKTEAETKTPRAKYLYEPNATADRISENLKNNKKYNNDEVTAKPSKAHPEKTTVRAVQSTSYGKYSGQGYRVQIYYGDNRYEALRRKAEFMRNHPGVSTYFTFTTPNYRVKVGNFRNREDATGMLREANGTYAPCMIVPDNVSIK